VDDKTRYSVVEVLAYVVMAVIIAAIILPIVGGMK
jgi:hypothetical protein